MQDAARARDLRDGMRDIAPAAIAACPIALIFGTLAVDRGLSVAESVLMSLTVFAGSAQFAALQLWTWPVPVFALVLSTALINSRHILEGASLAPKMPGFTGLRRFVAYFFMVDETWALAERRALKGPVSNAYWIGVCAPITSVWMGSTLLGALLGPFLGDGRRFGADFVFSALFIGLIAGFWKAAGPIAGVTLAQTRRPYHLRTGLAIAAAAAASAVVYVIAGPPWHVLAGAAAGIAAAALSPLPPEADA
jgi:4-azaleucine resistance transporter AzlC